VEKGEKTVRKLKTKEERSDFRDKVLQARREVNEIHAELFNLSLDNAGEYADVEARLKENREGFKIGGEVSQPVPNAPLEPDERINKLTGLPYNEGAGPAYMDQDDPLRALNMAAGGRVQKSVGGLIAKALGISDEDLEWAESQDQRFDPKGKLDGEGDAARHLALGWITQRTDNPERALQAANFRENLSITRKDKPMDQHNNNLGATIQANTYKEAEAEIDRLIKEKKAVFMSSKESGDLRPYGYAKGGKVYNTLKKNCS
jgi:hypothetical protein